MSTHSPENWTVDGARIIDVEYDGGICPLFEALAATDADMRLAAAAPALRDALRGIFEHCVMIHKQWGEGCNSKQAGEAIAAGRALLDAQS